MVEEDNNARYRRYRKDYSVDDLAGMLADADDDLDKLSDLRAAVVAILKNRDGINGERPVRMLDVEIEALRKLVNP